MRFVKSFAATLALITPAQAQSFSEWLSSFEAQARAAGISDEVLDEALSGLSLNRTVFERNDNQPEFSRAIWDYLDSAVSQSRVDNGREAIAANRARLDAIEKAYGVDAEIIAAIWGLESSYGRIMGDFDAIEALATLGFEGRRTAFGREQLMGALRIIQNGYATRDELKGSWAGAMGHTQFIPTTYLSYAIDHDGDGRRDIWGNLGDVFASTANYLARSGYRHNEPWGVEVRLPADFDYALADGETRKALAEWASLGLSQMRGDLIEGRDPNARARLIVPAGARGPAFLTFENFDAVLKYNRSTAYALAVGLLADTLAGREAGVVAGWPRQDAPLSLDDRKRLQEALAAQGYAPGPIDGIIGAGTKSALRRWQRDAGAPADGYASKATLEQLLR